MLLVLLLANNTRFGPLVGLGALAVIFLIFFSIRAIVKRKRFDTAPICTWKYTAADWCEHAEKFDLSDEPYGNAEVRITPTDILIFDSQSRIRKELDAYRKCVTACKFERGVLSFRVRGYRMRRRPVEKVLYFHDYHLPVPAGSEADAEKIAAFFNKQMADHPGKVTDVTPQQSGRAIFGEPNF